MPGKKDSKKKKDKEEGEGEEGEELEGSNKSEGGEDTEVSEDDLEKSLIALEAEAGDGDTDARKDVLLKKASTGLTKSENQELFKLLGDEPQPEEKVSEEIVKSLEANEDIAKALDVSDYLREQHTELVKSLEVVASEIEKGGNRQHGFNLVLAKAVGEVGRGYIETNKLIKSMAERLGVIESQPAREPKAQRTPVAKPMAKSFAGQDPGNGGGGADGGEDLSKADILDTLEDMISKSTKSGHAGNTEDGIDLTVAAAKMESFGQITPGLLARVKAHRQQGGATVQ